MIAYQQQAESYALTAEEREAIILEHMPQVKLIARRIHETLPGTIALDDLISSGIVGLIMAIDNYDPRQAVKLKTYAEYKIRGAILDSLRGLDWASRHRRRKYKEIEAAITSAEHRLQRPPAEEEIAGELGISLDEYRTRLIEVQGLTLGSLEYTVGADGGQELLNIIPSPDESPSAALERTTLENLLATAISELPEPEKLILALYYQEELTLREIGDIVQLKVTRVSELKTTSILRLRAQVAARWPAARGR